MLSGQRQQSCPPVSSSKSITKWLWLLSDYFSGFYPGQFQKFKVLISARAACYLKSWHKEEEEKTEKGKRKKGK